VGKFAASIERIKDKSVPASGGEAPLTRALSLDPLGALP